MPMILFLFEDKRALNLFIYYILSPISWCPNKEIYLSTEQLTDKNYLCLQVEQGDGIYAGWNEDYKGDNQLCYNLESGNTVRKDCPRGNVSYFHVMASFTDSNSDSDPIPVLLLHAA